MSQVAINIDDGDHGHSHGHGSSRGHDHSKCGGHGHDHGDDHGHDHGHGHGGHDHSHGKCGGHAHGNTHSERKGDLGKKWINSHGMEVKAFIYFMIINAWAFTCFLTTRPLEGYAFDKLASDIFMSFTAFMACLSYYITTVTKNNNPIKNVPAHAGPQEKNQCKTCSYWKPDRTHHCRACGECVLKMDHHCPWTVNCIGYRNHKSFVLMTTYIGLGGTYSVWRSIKHLTWTLDDETFYDMNILLMIYWILMSILTAFISIMVFGLAFYHTLLGLNNLTTLESMGGSNMKLPCDSQKRIDMKFINQYDKGMLANLFEFFGNTYFFWWYPTVPQTFYTGMYWETIGNPTPTEVLDYLRNKNGTVGETPEERILKPRNLSEVDLANIFKLAEEYTKDKHMQFFDKMLEVGKRKDHTYKAPQVQPQPQAQVNVIEQHDQHHQQQSHQNHEEQHQQEANETKENLLEKSPAKDSKSEISNVEVVKSETEEQDKEDVTVVSESTSNDPKAE